MFIKFSDVSLEYRNTFVKEIRRLKSLSCVKEQLPDSRRCFSHSSHRAKQRILVLPSQQKDMDALNEYQNCKKNKC